MDKFKKSLIQSGLSLLFLLAIFFLSNITSGLVIFSLASSVFIVFAFPYTDSSRPRFIIGGYIVASFWGLVFYFASNYFALGSFSGFDTSLIWHTLTFGFTMFTMIYKNYEHPPATAYAISVAASPRPFTTVALALASVLLLSLARWVFNRQKHEKEQ